jgi:flagellar biosynthetic protein FliR
MSWSVLQIFPVLPTFALVLFRLSGLLLVAPPFAGSFVPFRVRTGLAVAVSALIVPAVGQQVPQDVTLGDALAGGVGELMIGLAIGLGVVLLMTGVEAAGLIIGQQSAMALGEVLNPTLEEQSSLAAQIYSLSFVSLFLAAGGHRAAMAAVMDTYTVVPLLSFQSAESMVLLVSELLTAAFSLSLRLSGPVVLALFLTETAMGIVSRTIPQIHILTVGLGVRLLLAHGVAGLVLAGCAEPLIDWVHEGLDSIRSAFDPASVLAGGGV